MIRLRPNLAGSRLVMMIGGEAMQSALNLALNVALVQVLPAKQYGVFALVMVIGGIGLTYVRALTAMPASILIGGARRSAHAAVHDVTFGSVAVLGSAALAVVVSAVLSLWVEAGALAGGAFVGLWAIRSHVRTVFFAHGRQAVVGVGDLAYTLVGSSAALALWIGGDLLREVLLVLAAANAVSLGVMLALAGKPVRIACRRNVRRRYLAMGRQIGWSALSVTTTNLQGQGIALLVAGLAGPAAYAPIAAALVLFVPLRIIATAVANLNQPDISARLARGEAGPVLRSGLLWMGSLALGALAYGLAVALMLPSVSRGVVEASPPMVIGLAWIFYTLTMVSVMPRICLEVLCEFRSITIVTASSAAMGMVLAFLILLMERPSLALFGGVLSELMVLVGSGVVVWFRLGRLAGGGRRLAPLPACRQFLHSLFLPGVDDRRAEQGHSR